MGLRLNQEALWNSCASALPIPLSWPPEQDTLLLSLCYLDTVLGCGIQRREKSYLCAPEA